jgi:formamidopyrimidine-DNA glycosylase
MPELPDIVVYLESLEQRIAGAELIEVRLFRPFLLRTVTPPIESAGGRKVLGLRRLGKRIAIGLSGDLWLVIHLMIAGRLRWREAGAKSPGKLGLAAFDFSTGTLLLTEAGTKRRASLFLVAGETSLSSFQAGGIEVLEADPESFGAALRRENHTLKRALTDPRLFSGIGNAYSDEILFRAKLSPFKQTSQLTGEEIARVHEATRSVMSGWIGRLRREAGHGFPEKVTAFHAEMCVHGRYRKPCVVCGAPVQRIVYAENEANYCARCQTGGRLLADRALSRLLKGDWPKTIEELEEGRAARTLPP